MQPDNGQMNSNYFRDKFHSVLPKQLLKSIKMRILKVNLVSFKHEYISFQLWKACCFFDVWCHSNKTRIKIEFLRETLIIYNYRVSKHSETWVDIRTGSFDNHNIFVLQVALPVVLYVYIKCFILLQITFSLP